ncbi:Lpg1974 family pore-forming outer membrane protein [Amylibacter sp.]|nr:Lpg1974 family pore-forming outer membrane protein [Amylibacter sp.]
MTIRNHKLRAGIAFGAAVAAPLTTVQAQTQNSEDYTVIRTEGGMSESKFTQSKIGEIDEANIYDRGLYGSVEILRSVNNGWDWSVSATSQDLGTILITEDQSGLLNLDTSFSSRSIDFDLGKNFQRKNMDLRLSAGLTALQIEEQKGLDAFEGPPQGYPFASNVSNKYLGIGGRLGMDAKLRLGENSPFSIFAGASTAITHGEHDMRKGTSFYDELSENQINNVEVSQRMISSGNVNHTSANIGLEVEAGNNTTFRIGVRHDKYSFDISNPSMLVGDSISGNTGYVGVAIRF